MMDTRNSNLERSAIFAAKNLMPFQHHVLIGLVPETTATRGGWKSLRPRICMELSNDGVQCSELSLRRFKVQLCLGFRIPEPGSQRLQSMALHHRKILGIQAEASTEILLGRCGSTAIIY